MPKRSNGKKRGIQRGVAKHKVRSKKTTKVKIGENGEEMEIVEYDSLYLGIPQSTYFKLGHLAFEISFWACGKLHLLPFTRNESGEYVPLDPKMMVFHYGALALFVAACLHKLLASAYILIYEELRIESFMCVSLFLIYFTSMSVSLVVAAKPKESMDLMNAWPKFLSCLERIQMKGITPMDDMSTSLKVITVFLVTQGIAFAGSIMSLVFSHIPACWFPAAESIGLIPDGVLPRFGWQVVFFPLEYATYLPPMFSAAYSSSILLIGCGGIMKIYLEKLRKIKITDLESRALVEYLYICTELYNRVLHVYLRFMLPPTIFGVSSAIIVTTFVAIRYTELPFIFYIFYPYSGGTLMTIIFWLCYDAVCIVRLSEDILADLLAFDPAYLRSKSKADRVKILKRARAMKVLDFPIGPFADFSMTLPINIWEECLNQVLFLLTF